MKKQKHRQLRQQLTVSFNNQSAIVARSSRNCIVLHLAYCTCIDDAIAQQLGLPVIDVVQMTSASHANTQQNVYPAKITLMNGINIDVPRAIGAALQAQNIIALIGRDFLQHCTIFYNGLTDAITLSL